MSGSKRIHYPFAASALFLVLPLTVLIGLRGFAGDQQRAGTDKAKKAGAKSQKKTTAGKSVTPRRSARIGPAQLQIGKVAPDIVGEDIDGVKFKLSDYRGKVVVLDFWGDW